MSEPRKPKCADCGKLSDAHAAPRPGTIPGTSLGHVWLCLSCEFLRENPDAPRLTTHRRPRVPQEESLLS